MDKKFTLVKQQTPYQLFWDRYEQSSNITQIAMVTSLIAILLLWFHLATMVIRRFNDIGAPRVNALVTLILQIGMIYCIVQSHPALLTTILIPNMGLFAWDWAAIILLLLSYLPIISMKSFGGDHVPLKTTMSNSIRYFCSLRGKASVSEYAFNLNVFILSTAIFFAPLGLYHSQSYEIAKESDMIHELKVVDGGQEDVKYIKENDKRIAVQNSQPINLLIHQYDQYDTPGKVMMVCIVLWILIHFYHLCTVGYRLVGETKKRQYYACILGMLGLVMVWLTPDNSINVIMFIVVVLILPMQLKQPSKEVTS